MAERGVSLHRRTCDRSLLPICCPRPFQVSYLLGMLRTTAGVVIGPSIRQATDTSICRHFEDGSDGTRTRDLRRDRPLQVQRRLPMNRFNLCHLRGLLALELVQHSMVA